MDEAAGLRRPEELVVVGPDPRAPFSRTIATSWNRALHNRRAQTAGSNPAEIDIQSTHDQSDTGTKAGIGQRQPGRLLASCNVARPQINFSDQIDNSNKPFVSKLRFKHNAKERVQRDKVLIVDDDNQGSTKAPMETDMET